MTAGPPDRPQLVAPVGGFPALVIAKLLEDAMPARVVYLQRLIERGHLRPERMTELRETWAAIRSAAREWETWWSAAGDRAAEQVTAVPQGSSGEREVDTTTAACLLGVTPNRVRQLARAGDLPGRRAGRMWLIDRAAAELRRDAG